MGALGSLSLGPRGVTAASALGASAPSALGAAAASASRRSACGPPSASPRREHPRPQGLTRPPVGSLRLRRPRLPRRLRLLLGGGRRTLGRSRPRASRPLLGGRLFVFAARGRAAGLFVRQTKLRPLRSRCSRHSSLLASPCVAAVKPRRRELPELVTDHRLGDEHRHVLTAVVDGDRVTNHVREDHGRYATRSSASASHPTRSSPRRAPSGAPARTGPSYLNDSTSYSLLTAADDVLVRVLALLSRVCGTRGWEHPTASLGDVPEWSSSRPPPCGWSTGFTVVPRVCGRIARGGACDRPYRS